MRMGSTHSSSSSSSSSSSFFTTTMLRPIPLLSLRLRFSSQLLLFLLQQLLLLLLLLLRVLIFGANNPLPHVIQHPTALMVWIVSVQRERAT
jgi:hypothetical protein